MPRNLAVGRSREQGACGGIGLPLPQRPLCLVAQGEAVEMQETWAIGRVQSQLGEWLR
ncbi:hypothetical protein D3C71_1823500 [compost metagenome]